MFSGEMELNCAFTSVAPLVSCSVNCRWFMATPTMKSLLDAFKSDFMVGVAMNQRQFTEQDTNGATLVKAQFNSISPENILKWESVHPQPDRYDFAGADRYVEFGEKNHMYLIG